ncbi:hypothetical protein ACFWJS_33735 [Streptomyces sp. NPDC127061]|uniref:hypothetical protein n=1 Tax=Streptomyces sp. NPDC127061 TaxID=3347122 RepID=UPI0036465067
MSALLRKSRELRWYCSCCSMDSAGGRIAKRMVKRTAKRREERRWVREAREETEPDPRDLVFNCQTIEGLDA